MYREIAQHYRDRIINGELADGHQLPTSRQMALTWEVTRVTVGKAMAMLASEGLVETLGRNGTRVVARRGVTVETLPSDDPLEQEFEQLTLQMYRARGFDTSGARVEILNYGSHGNTVSLQFRLVYADGSVASGMGNNPVQDAPDVVGDERGQDH